MDTIPGIIENGLVRPLTPLDLPESTPVTIVVPESSTKESIVDPLTSPEGMEAIYEILSHRYNSGHHDTAARHNEHQP